MTENGAARYIESIRLNVDARIIMSMLVSYYAYVRTRPIDRSRELYIHARLARDNSLEFSQRCVAFFSRLNASIAVQTSETRSS